MRQLDIRGPPVNENKEEDVHITYTCCNWKNIATAQEKKPCLIKNCRKNEDGKNIKEAEQKEAAARWISAPDLILL